MDLLVRSEIFSDALQVDYFCDRIHPQLQQAVSIWGAQTLVDAINICNEVEYDMKRTGLTLSTYTTIPPNSMSAPATATPSPPATEPAQNAQWTTHRGQHRRNSNYRPQHNSNNRSPQHNNRNNNRQSQQRDSRRCFNCNWHEHISKDCRQPRWQKEHSNNQQIVQPDSHEEYTDIFQHLLDTSNNNTCNQQHSNNTNGLRFHANIHCLNDDRNHRLLLDTGSTLSSIRKATTERIGATMLPCKPTTICYGNQSVQLTTESVTLEFIINNIPTTSTLYVVDQQNEEIILGMNWMIKEDITLHPKSRMISKTASSNNAEHQSTIEQLLTEFPNLTSSTEFQTITNAPFQHHIDTGDANPVVCHDYRRSLLEKAQITKEVEIMLQCKVISPSNSPWCSPVILIKKPDGFFRFCVDFRALNVVTRKDKFPLPRIDDLLEDLHDCKCLSLIDLKSGYWQLPVHPKDRHKTSFIANGSLYCFNVLPFGICNGPATFSRFMSVVTQGLPCNVYLDDILVWTRDEQSHFQALRQVLSRLNQYGLKISVPKSKFFCKEVRYLGFIVSSNGIYPDPEKQNLVENWPPLKSVKELQRFLGFCAFHHKFIRHLSQTAAPLHKLLHKNTPFNWQPEHQDAFVALKKRIAELPTLAYSQPHLLNEIHTDASTHGLGSILVQNGRPIAFASRSLTTTEKNYTTTELKCLSIVYALSYFHPFIYGALQLTIYSDHAALKSILSTKMPWCRIAR